MPMFVETLREAAKPCSAVSGGTIRKQDVSMRGKGVDFVHRRSTVYMAHAADALEGLTA